MATNQLNTVTLEAPVAPPICVDNAAFRRPRSRVKRKRWWIAGAAALVTSVAGWVYYNRGPEPTAVQLPRVAISGHAE